MSGPIGKFWSLRLEKCKKALQANNFKVFLAESSHHAAELILSEIIPAIGPKTISWGDSMTLHETGVIDILMREPHYDVLVTFDASLPREEIIERRRQALLVDLFLTGTNAVTQTGQLVNLDMVGNRVAAVAFGPKHVVITAGRNKIVEDLNQAMRRVKEYAAPINAIRHPLFKTPCIRTSFCMDCKSPDRICNVWTITEKSFPKERIKIVLINEDLGL
ncbi:MAG: lactate utilization protein [Deltaproteobacteria bacterium]|nr:lactate utilization protein [Deltaproteobacteria bacterium]